MNNIKTIAVFLLLSAAGPAYAASAGAEPFNFLFLDANARAVGMGGAYTALAADANALLYNPAGLARIDTKEATFMHNRYFQDINQEYLAFASPNGWGASFNYLDFGRVGNTTLSNHTGAGLGSSGLTDLAFGAGCAHAVSPEVSLGVGLKFIREDIAGESGQGIGLDAGILYSPAKLRELKLGAAIQNIGPSVKFQGEKERLPLNFRAGAAYGFSRATVSFDITKERSGGMLAAIGAEGEIIKFFLLRFGYNSRNDAGPGITAGIGYADNGTRNDLRFDYAFAPFKELGAAHRFSVTVLWGKAE